MTRRDMITGLLASTPALKGLTLQPGGVVCEECKVLILSVDPSLLAHVVVDRKSIEETVEKAFKRAGLRVPQIVVLQGLKIEGMAK